MYLGAHVGVVVEDAERSARFYRDVLQCEADGSYEDQRIKLLYFRAGTLVIELLQYLTGDAVERKAGRVDHIAFYVDDMDAAVARLASQGAEFIFKEPVVMAGGKKIFFFAGPDGERLEFIQEAKK